MEPARFEAIVVGKRFHGYATELLVEAPNAAGAVPGQFMHIKCDGRDGVIMRRPYSVFDAAENTISFLVKDVGRGSAWLSARKTGDILDLMGPLGRGFAVGDGQRSILVAGGTGIAPLHFLAGCMKERGLCAFLLWGMEGGDEYGELPNIIADRFDLRLSSMDGKRGIRGSAVDLLEACREEGCTALYACGPRPMLLSLTDRARDMGFTLFQVSLEERMACGVGACRGCVIPCSTPTGGYLSACRDGPVFDEGEVDWRRIRESISA
ncbi:MAG: dihydroorotate dehydrogenase electron transfer subunit [Actinomycetota bacterium]|nr:dihydroorotate dehydrogenase electron transfer subunit [Actinomycetota bacterium]